MFNCTRCFGNAKHPPANLEQDSQTHYDIDDDTNPGRIGDNEHSQNIKENMASMLVFPRVCQQRGCGKGLHQCQQICPLNMVLFLFSEKTESK